MRQASRSYGKACLVLLQDEVGLAGLAGLEDGTVAGVASAEDRSTFRTMSETARCIVLLAFMPGKYRTLSAVQTTNVRYFAVIGGLELY